MTAAARLDAGAAALFVAFAVLGAAVARRPLGAWDARAAHLRAKGIPAALLLTKSGRLPALTVLYAVAIAIYAAAHLSLVVPLLLALAQICSQVAAEFCKALYKRVRPDYWLIGLEAGHSYPSGHATTSLVTFGGWSLIASESALPPEIRFVAAGLLALWAAGICWSRLALGAHYLSDVAGGILFGGAWLALLASAVSILAR